MSSETTTDHDRIREWTEARGGRPSVVRTGGEHGGVIRIDFGPKEENLEPTDWDEWFQVFEESKLAMILQDQTADGKESRFNRLIGREHAEDGGSRRDDHRPEGEKKSHPRKTAGGKTTGAKPAGAAKPKAAKPAAAPAKTASGKAEASAKADAKPSAKKAPAKKSAAKPTPAK